MRHHASPWTATPPELNLLGITQSQRGSCSGKGANTTLKMAVFAPIPSTTPHLKVRSGFAVR